ncbi:MAG: immunoglobulin-like domain-containing protein [Campylobacterota bacterium]
MKKISKSIAIALISLLFLAGCTDSTGESTGAPAAVIGEANATNENTTVLANPVLLPVETNTTITVTLADSNGVLLTTGGDNVTLTGKGSNQTGTISAVTDNNDGTYTFMATQTTATKVTYTGTVNDVNITDPAIVEYTEAPVVDITPPVITLEGANPQEVVIDTAYTELGATASDDVDGDITANIVIDASDVNTSAVGSYAVTYDVNDSAGNPAVQVSRTVNVIAADTTAPVIVLVGENPQEVILNSAYVELGATASDNVDGDLTANIVIDASDVNTSAVGSYAVTYDVNDSAGNPAVQVSRTVNVVADTTAPVIVLIGANPQEIVLNSAYVELNATASDDVDGDISANIVIDASAVDTNTTGTYLVTYNVTDAVGNPADEVIRTVTVFADTTAPVIVLIGANPQQVVLDSAYVELNATASDNVDGDISANIVIDASDVNTSALGDYNVTYNVVDAVGNPAIEVRRTVSVVDTIILDDIVGQTLTFDGNASAEFSFYPNNKFVKINAAVFEFIGTWSGGTTGDDASGLTLKDDANNTITVTTIDSFAPIYHYPVAADKDLPNNVQGDGIREKHANGSVTFVYFRDPDLSGTTAFSGFGFDTTIWAATGGGGHWNIADGKVYAYYGINTAAEIATYAFDRQPVKDTGGPIVTVTKGGDLMNVIVVDEYWQLKPPPSDLNKTAEVVPAIMEMETFSDKLMIITDKTDGPSACYFEAPLAVDVNGYVVCAGISIAGVPWGGRGDNWYINNDDDLETKIHYIVAGSLSETEIWRFDNASPVQGTEVSKYDKDGVFDTTQSLSRFAPF